MAFCIEPYSHPNNKRLDASSMYMAGPRRESPMRNRWRSEEEPRDRNHYSRKPQRSRSPVSRDSLPTSRQRTDYPSRSDRKREFSPEPRRPPPRRPSLSPVRSPRPHPARYRPQQDLAFSSRDHSPVRFPKRRRTRSPSPENWSDRDFGDRRRFSRSRSRDRYDQRDLGPPNRRTFSPRRNSPRPRSISRGGAPEVDTYIPERRRPNTPPRRGQRRSPTPRRSSSPPPRRRSRTPPARRFPSRPESPQSRHTSPYPTKRGRGRDITPDYARDRRKPYSRTPSVAGDFDQEHMDGPSALRGNHGNPNYMPRGRGRRPYNPNRGSFRGSSVAGSPYSSHHGSPQSNSSYHGGRGGWESHQQRFSPPLQNMQPFRQNSSGAGQTQEEYFRSQQQAANHPHSNPNRRPFRGGRGQYRGGPFPPGPDRRFSGPDPNETPINPRGRGAHTNSVQWLQNPKRGGSNNNSQIGTGANSIRTSPGPLSKKSQNDVPESSESLPPHTPKGPQADEASRQDAKSGEQPHDGSPNQKDVSKFSFAFKSKPPPQSPAKPPPDLTSKVKLPPTRPASDREPDDRPPYDRPPPTQPKAIRLQERRNQNHGPQSGRRDGFEGPGRPLIRPQQQVGQAKEIPTEPRQRSRSPTGTKSKPGTRPKPKMTPEMAASDSIYYRKPGNESVVGAGTYGKVFKAVHIYTKDEAALKKIRMEGERDGFPITAVREIKLLQNLRHKHVVALQEVMVEKNECFMVFEYMAHDLTGLINHPTFKLAPAHKKDLGRQMFEGLEFLHRRGVMHRDIKAANLLISSEGQLKYADFGLARFYTKSRKLDYTNRVITIWYRPPELLLGETQYGPAVDIWSAACVFMEMFTRKAIFPGEGGELSQLEKIYNVLGIPNTKEWPGIVDLPWYELMQPAVVAGQASSKDKQEKDTKFGQRVFETNYSSLLSPAALDLVRQIFSYDPAIRPSAAQVLEHEYFTSEEPAPRQPYELAEVAGEWHELESKQHRKDLERKEKEKRRDEYVKEREKRKAKEAGLDIEKEANKKVKGENISARIDEVPAAPLPVGEEDASSDAEGSARMSMS